MYLSKYHSEDEESAFPGSSQIHATSQRYWFYNYLKDILNGVQNKETEEEGEKN